MPTARQLRRQRSTGAQVTAWNAEEWAARQRALVGAANKARSPEWREQHRKFMRALWEDPQWSTQQRAKIREAQHRSGRPRGANYGKNGLVQINVRIGVDALEALQAQAHEQGQSIAELVRTYITWGLEEEGACRD